MFEQELQKLVAACEGGIGAVLMDSDGMVVQTVRGDGAAGLDIEAAAMEFSFVLGQVRKAVESLQAGDLDELTVRTDRVTLVLRSLTPEYFVALAIDPRGNSGQGRFLLRVTAPRLKAGL